MTIVNRLSWYAARMRAMSPAEVAWRLGTRAASELRQGAVPELPGDAGWGTAFHRFRVGQDRPVLLDAARAPAVAAAAPDDVAALLRAADAVAAGRFGFFGDDPVAFPAGEIDWNLDPRTGHRWPLVAARSIDHRTHDGDPKWIWELNRLQHLPWLAQAWLFTGERRYADAALDQLDSWLAQNPVGRGIAWRGGFEAGVRALSVAVALQGLRASPGLTLHRYRRIVTMLAASAELAWRQRSLFSSANNHLLGELAGVATVALLHPEIPSANRLRGKAMAVLAREAGRQFLPDGVNAEQATGYQIFAAELLLVPVALVRLRGESPPAAMTEALRREAAYLRVLTADGREALPRTGDDDGGFALRLHADPEPDVRRHLAAVDAVLGHAPDGAPGSGTDGGRPGLGTDVAAAWLAGAAPRRAPRPRPAAADHHASHGGVVVLRRGPLRLLMDVGPLGHLTLAAHGHADALAVTVASDGRDVIGDPGTGSYYAHPDWRAAFRGTRMHATAAVDDLDQSVPGGPFLWVRHAATTVRTVDLARGVVDAEHNGYTRLDQPVTHRRWLYAPPDGGAVVVVDAFTGAGSHRLRTTWPVHPRLDVTAQDGGHRVTEGGAAVLHVASAGTVALTEWAVRGDEDTQLGWWSDRFESRVPAWLVGAVTERAVELPAVVATVLTAGEAQPPGDLAVAHVDGRIDISWTEGADHHEVTVAPDRPGALTHRRSAGG